MAKKQSKESVTGTITDPLIEPYFISMDENNYTLYKRYDGVKTDKQYMSVVGHYSTVKGCLSTLATKLAKQGQYQSIQEFIDRYDTIVQKFNVLDI